MPIRPIVLYPDPQLTKPCSDVVEFDEQLVALVDDLTSTMYSTTGIGLSAPQIGVLQQVLVMDLTEKRTMPKAYVNPRIVEKSGFAIAHESCLSLPGIEAKVIRSALLRLKAFDAQGEEFEQELSGMSAICMQHELDHLQGRLFIDRLSSFRRFCLRGKINNLHLNAQQLKLA